MKIDSQHLDEALAKIKDLMPDNFADLKNTGEDKLKLILEGLLQKLEMVSREEYEIQTEVLQRTRQRLEQLEQRIELLEKK
jgi:BMFP domain-containing protein YqiC